MADEIDHAGGAVSARARRSIWWRGWSATSSPRLSAPPVVVENRTGANGTLGSNAVARAAPDGAMLLITTASTHVTAVHLMKNLPYDPIKDFTPIAAAVEPVTCLVVNGALPVNSVEELVAYAKARPGELAYGSSGVGSVFHLMGELFNQTAGVKINHVPYRGVAPALQDVIAGHIPMAFLSISNALAVADAKSVKISGGARAHAVLAAAGHSLNVGDTAAFRKPIVLVRLLRTGRPAGPDGDKIEQRDRDRAQCARRADEAERQRHGRARRHAGGIQGPDQGRHRTLRRHHQGRRRAAGIGLRLFGAIP